MQKTMSPKRWLICFAAILLAILLALAGFMYAFDPFFQFRVRNNTYFFDSRFANAGLIKNYDYDLLILGSSMTQNFHMDVFREEMGVEPLHASVSGIKPYELSELLNLAIETGKADQIISSIEIGTFRQEVTASKNPQYLLGNDILSRLHYLFSYEAWFRYLPANIRLAWQKTRKSGLSEGTLYDMNIDNMGAWERDFSVGREQVLDTYFKEKAKTIEENSADIYKNLTEGMDKFFDSIQPTDAQLSFFFPPYSALYWIGLGEKRNAYLDAKEYFIEKATEKGYIVYDFHGEDYIRNLDKYRDPNHYSGEINDLMTLCFASGTHIVTPENMKEYRAKLLSQIELFREEYAGVI